jgi:hypothetical protein
MNPEHRNLIEELQRLVARTVATHPAGRNLLLIGGFRYRFLDHSVRASDDIDYHWAGDLAEKQRELLDLFDRRLLPEVRRRLGLECLAGLAGGADADSPFVRIVELSFWKMDSGLGRIEIPVELTRIACADPVAIRTADGTIYPTVSDADMVESKVIAIFNRLQLRHRDLVDVFLFRNQLRTDSASRLAAKSKDLAIPGSAITERMADFRNHQAYHARALQDVVDAQLEPAAAAQIRDVGGGVGILSETLRVLESLFPAEAGHAGA